MNAKTYEIDLKKGVVNRGNLYRISCAMKKAMDGKPVTVGFLGGSITQGCLSSSPETCYAYLVYKWWCESFPGSRVTYVNAGIGGLPPSLEWQGWRRICFPKTRMWSLWNSA